MPASASQAALACRNDRCGQAFGGPVRFCPYCGAAQAVAAAAPADRPAPPPNPWSAAPAPGHPPAPPDLPPAAPEPAAAVWNKPPRRRSWKGTAAGLCVLAGIAWLFRGVLTPAAGEVVVSVSPALDGVVTLDGADAGRPAQTLTAAAGDHMVGLRAPHWSTQPVRVTLRAGHPAHVTLAPKPDPAALLVQAQPADAVISVNGRKVGPSPATLSLAPGTWRVSAEAPGFRPAAQSVTLTPGEQHTASLRLDPVPDTRTRVLAQAGAWSAPVLLAPGDSFSFTFKGRARARIDGRVFLLDGTSINLGTVEARSVQLKSAADGVLPVDVLIRHAPAP